MSSNLKKFNIHQPHDSLFKEAFKNKEVAMDFLKSRLSYRNVLEAPITSKALQEVSSLLKEIGIGRF